MKIDSTIVATASILLLLIITAVLISDRNARQENVAKNFAQDSMPFFEPGSCWFVIPDSIRAKCGFFYTDAITGRFKLPVVILQNQDSLASPEPLVYLSGGPGNGSFLSASDIDRWFYWFEDAGIQRDLVLMDQRGTGMSEPQWNCQNYQNFVRTSLRVNPSLEEESKAAHATIAECIAVARSRGFDPNDFTTSINARDMADLMRALDYEHWHVFGVSYGSRLALEWLRLYPQGIKSLILDSVYPFNKGLFSEWPQLLAQSFNAWWSLCDHGCGPGQTSADVEQKFWQSLQRLRQRPIELTVDRWDGDWPLTVKVNDYRFVSGMYSAQYDSYLHDSMLISLEEILNNGYPFEHLQKIVEHGVNSELSGEFNLLVYFATECAETPTVNQLEYQRKREQYPEWMPYTQYDIRTDVCGHFSKRRDLETFRQNFYSDISALILSGALDPVTPSSWAAELHAALGNSRLIVANDVGHGVVASSACGFEYLRRFLNDPEATVQTQCEIEK